MKKRSLPILLTLLLAGKIGLSQSATVIKDYIAQFKEIAIEEMKRTGVPASITLAQGIHETAAGQSVLVKKSNNHFGIKCKSDWQGESVSHDDDARGECFRKYPDPFQSYRDHSDFLKNRAHYASLFSLDPTDYEAWAHGLKKAGYATNPKYPQILIKLINDYNLQDYTLIAMGRKENTPGEVWAVVTKEQNGTKETTAIAGGPNAGAAVKSYAYPSGTFKINETSVLFIAKGTPYLVIAQQHGIGLARLFDFNDMEKAEVAAYDQLVYLQRKRKTGASEFHKVAEGETLHGIAQAEGIRLESLLELNLLTEVIQPAVGEILYLQRKAPVAPRKAGLQKESMAYAPAAPTNTFETFVVHTVQPKETVYAISKRYAVSMDEVLKWNEMESTDLKTGQQIRINKKTAHAAD